MDRQLINIFLLGSAFMILFTAFQTTTMISQSVLEGVKNETINGTSFHGNGYISQAILYSCFTIANIFAPVIVSKLGPSISMFLGATTYFLYVLSYISPMTWSYYIVSILVGIGAALLWTGQGVYLAINSDDLTISQNSGIFWALFQVSLLAGNIYIYASLKTEIIDHKRRYSLFSIFSVISAIGLMIFICIIWRSLIERRRNILIKTDTLTNFTQTLKTAGRLLKTRNMLLLLILFAYIGLSPTFFIVVYGTCIGHYIKYGDARKRLIGLHGILLGSGEILGGGVFGFITKPKTSSQLALMVLSGFILHIIFYYFVFINLPFDASSHETDSKPYVDFSSTISQVITFMGSFIAGLGDSSLNTQVMNVLGSRYKQNSASVFAIFKLVQALGSGIAFFYAGSLAIQWQLLILVSFLFMGTLAFFYVLFNDKTNELSTFVTIQEDNEGINSVTSSFE